MKKSKIELSASKPRLLELSTSVDEYLARVMEDNLYLHFGNPEGPLASDRLKLLDVWQMPRVTVGGTEFLPQEVDPGRRTRLLNTRNPLPLWDVLQIDSLRSLVITAPPGFGKSTLCSYMANLLACDARANKTGWIPLVVPLRSVNLTGPWETVEQLISRLAAVRGDKELIKRLDEHLLKGDLWFFLDGLDEVHVDALSRVRAEITKLAASSARVTVTCRLGDYMSITPTRSLDLPTLTLEEFSDDELNEYVDKWHHFARIPGRMGESNAMEKRLAATRAIIEQNTEVRSLAKTPLLAAVICVVGASAASGPSSRAALFQRAVEHMLAPRDMATLGGDCRQADDYMVHETTLHLIAKRLAFEMLENKGQGSGPALLIKEEDLQRSIAAHFQACIESTIPPNQRDHIAKAYFGRIAGTASVGLMHQREAGCYEFVHKRFQEYLCAQFLGKYVDRRKREALALDPEWTEVFHFIASIAQFDGSISDVLILVSNLLKRAESSCGMNAGLLAQTDIVALASGCLAGEMLVDIGRPALKAYGFASALDESSPAPNWRQLDAGFAGIWPDAVKTAFAIARRDDVPLPLRMRAMCISSQLGDPRFIGNAEAPNSVIIHLLYIPGGTAQIGTDKPLPMKEFKKLPSNPHHIASVDSLEIGKYSVTNLEYGQFIAENGYGDDHWWLGDAAIRWRRSDSAFCDELVNLFLSRMEQNFWKEQVEADFRRTAAQTVARRMMFRSQPLYWNDSRFNLPTAPVVGVNLWEARAYCKWLEHTLRCSGDIGDLDVVDVPTEYEWEWVASMQWRGTRLHYPWGDVFDASRCLTRDFKDPNNPQVIRYGALPVGFFDVDHDDAWDIPSDLGGNVWHWTASLALPYGPPPSPPNIGELHPCIVRGGSWFSNEKFATHSSFRMSDEPCNAYWDLGFRIVIRRGKEQDR